LSNVLLLTLGTGVGGAALCDGRMLRGAAGVAGHFGHLSADPDGAPCMCGNRGCLETVFSSRAIEAEVSKALHLGASSPYIDAIRDMRAKPECEAIFDAAAQGDAIASAVVDRAIHGLAAAIAGLMLAFDPQVLILTGSIANAGQPLFETLNREVAGRTRRMLGRDVPIVPAGVADNSGVSGAAALGYLLCRS
jgi:predicted NBD/HSP70 family sugar kinase